MIRPIDIKINAAHPELPLAEASAYTGAPSTVLIRGVPGSCGKWAITAVQVCATFPDNATVCREAVQSANGVWVATIPGSSTSGRTRSGLWITASGVDENGAAVTGYILGVADFAIYALGTAPAPAPGGTAYALRYFDTLPDPAKKGDVIRANGDLKFYNGAEWLPFTDLSDYYTAEQVDEAIDKLAAYYITYTAAGAAFPTRAALLSATVVYSGGAARTPTRNDYAVVLADESHGGAEWRYVYTVAAGATSGQWVAQYPIETNDYDALANKPQINGNTLTGNKTGAQLGVASTADATLTERFSTWTMSPATMPGGDAYPQPELVDLGEGNWQWKIQTTAGLIFENEEPGAKAAKEAKTSIAFQWAEVVTATRTALPGYQLGEQSSKPLASEAEAEALRTGKLDKSGGTMTGDLRIFTGSGTAVMRVGADAASALTINQSGFYHGGSSGFTYLNALPDVSGTLALAAPNPTAGNLAALDANGNPTDSGVKPSDKLDSTSAAPAFSTSSTYAVGEHVTYNGGLYRCTTAVTTAGAWDASKWTADTMTDPDAVLDITAQNQLRVVAKDGTVLWAQGYNLASTSGATLACDATNNFTFANGATSQAFTLPTAPTGKVGDFGLDIDNSANTNAATMTLTGLDTTFSAIIPKGESLNDMLAIAAGELARFYVTLSTFRVNNLPTWHIVKQVVENGGAQS